MLDAVMSTDLCLVLVTVGVWQCPFPPSARLVFFNLCQPPFLVRKRISFYVSGPFLSRIDFPEPTFRLRLKPAVRVSSSSLYVRIDAVADAVYLQLPNDNARRELPPIAAHSPYFQDTGTQGIIIWQT